MAWTSAFLSPLEAFEPPELLESPELSEPPEFLDSSPEEPLSPFFEDEESEPSPVGYFELVGSPYQRVQKSFWRPTMLALALAPVKILPKSLSLRYSEHLLYRARRVRFE